MVARRFRVLGATVLGAAAFARFLALAVFFLFLSFSFSFSFLFLLFLVCLTAFAYFWTEMSNTKRHSKGAGCTRGVCVAQFFALKP